MLALAERLGKDDVISWLPGGKGFRVHKKEEFCETIMPNFFASSKYKTFQVRGRRVVKELFLCVTLFLCSLTAEE